MTTLSETGSQPDPPGRLELRCCDCGYGIVVDSPPPDRCPMCQNTDWVPVDGRFGELG